jgi:hypothetical protein
LVASEIKAAALLVAVSPAARPAAGENRENNRIRVSHGSPGRVGKLKRSFGWSCGIWLSPAQYDDNIMLQASLCGKRQLTHSTGMDAASHCLGWAFRLPFCLFGRRRLMAGYRPGDCPKRTAAEFDFGG